MRVVHAWLYDRFAAGARWENLKSTSRVLEVKEQIRVVCRRSLSLPSDHQTVEVEEEEQEDAALEEISPHAAGGSAVW